jgi:ribosomal protein S18 acetylase RimI-like enzyme
MQASVAIAQAQGKQAIWLGVWEHNQRAIQFYTAWGFEKVGEHDFQLGNDVQRDWIMQKKL